jgi:hypothetical protein
MMIDFELFQFATAPGTGGDWFVDSCLSIGLHGGFDFLQLCDKIYIPFDDANVDKLRVTMVRHPLEILIQCFYLPASIRPIPFDKIHAKSSSAFVQEVVALHPGAVGRLIDSYEANMVMRWEDMPHAAVELFGSLGVPNQLLDRIKPIREKREEWRAWAGTAVIRAAAEAEREMMEKYDYAW